MALTGKFIGDFSSFQDAVAKADVSLKTLGDGASTVGTKLNRMTDQFSGRKLIQDAELMTRAIEEAGGSAALTGKQLQAAGAQAAEAAEKMEKLGMEVPAGLKKIATEAENAKQKTGGFTDVMTTMKGVLGSLGIGLSIGAVVSFGKAILETADSLSNMSAKTGIGVESLQRLQQIAAPSGNTIDQVASAVNRFQKGIAEGSPATIKALNDIGISFNEIRHQSPEAQFIAIAKGIQEIQDPAEQARIAMEIFGKAGAELLPTLKADIDKLAAATVVMSEDSVKAWDDAGDAMGKYYDDWKARAGNWIAGFIKSNQDADQALTDLETKRQLALGKRTGDIGLPPAPKLDTGAFDLTAKIGLTNAAFRQLNEISETTQTDVTNDFKKISDAAERSAAEIRKEFDKLAIATPVGPFNLDSKATAGLGAIRPAITGITADMKILESTTIDAQVGFLRFGQSSLTAAKQADTFGSHIKTGLTDVLAGVPQTIVNAFTGGGSVLGAVQGIGSQLGATVGSSISKTISSLGALAGPLGSAVGSLIGPAIGLIGKLFEDTEKKINPIREAFVQTAGGLEVLNGQAAAAGVTLTAMLDAKNPKEYEKAIGDLNAALKFQDDAMKVLEETTKRYGFTIEELGPALGKQELDKQAQQIFKDWEVLNAAGIDTISISTRMADSVNAYVAQAVAMGGEVPDAMRPMLEKMIEMGELTDASGNKIETLEGSGLSFSMSMSKGFETLIGAVDRLSDAISRGLGLAVDTTSSKIRNMPTKVAVDVVYNDPGLHGSSTEMEGFAEGTGGFRNFGAGTPVVLHGWEAVVPRDQASGSSPLPPMLAAAAGGAVAVAPVVVTIDARGALFNDPGSDQRLADRIAQALDAKHALQHKRRAA